MEHGSVGAGRHERRIRRNADRLLGKADAEHDQERQQEEQGEPSGRQRHNGGAAAHFAHASSTSAASARHDSETVSPAAKLPPARAWFGMVTRTSLPPATATR